MFVVSKFVSGIIKDAEYHRIKSGAVLFDNLPKGVRDVVSGSSFDPSGWAMTQAQLFAWVDDHLIFDSEDIIGVFSGDFVLWRRP